MADGELKGLARGLAYRLIEAGGVLAAPGWTAELKASARPSGARCAPWACASAPSRLYSAGAGPARGARASPAPSRSPAAPDWPAADRAPRSALPSPRRRAALLGAARLAAPAAAGRGAGRAAGAAGRAAARGAKQGEGWPFSRPGPRRARAGAEPTARAMLRGLGFAPVGARPRQPARSGGRASRGREPVRDRARPTPFAALAALGVAPPAGAAAPPPEASVVPDRGAPSETCRARRLALARALLQDPDAGGALIRERPRAPARGRTRRAGSTSRAGR